MEVQQRSFGFYMKKMKWAFSRKNGYKQVSWVRIIFCGKCLSCFHHKSGFDKHECNKHYDCVGYETKQTMPATIGKEQAKYLRNKLL